MVIRRPDVQQTIRTIRSVQPLHVFEFDEQMVPVAGDLDSPIFFLLFGLDRMQQGKMPGYEQRQPAGSVSLLINSIGLSWIADVVPAGEEIDAPFHTCVLGPAFLDEYSLQEIEQRLLKREISVRWTKEALKALKNVPVIPISRMYEYGIMFHYGLTGDAITAEDFRPKNTMHPETQLQELETMKDPGIFQAEHELLRFIEEGNLSYQEFQSRLMTGQQLTYAADLDFLRQMKNYVIAFLALATRAAIRGGLYTVTAYGISDYYMQAIEHCGSIDELTKTSHEIMDVFVRRVHEVKQRGGISLPVQEAMNYISGHIAEPLKVKTLADAAGYSESWFAKQFRKETGMSVRAYVTQSRLKEAERLLLQTRMPVIEIAEKTGFRDQSYFGRCFHEKYGCSPLEYRRQSSWKTEKENHS